MTRRPTSTEPGALDRAGLRAAVVALSTVQITSWGVLYYAFAALQASISADTGWSAVAVTGAFSLALLVSGAAGVWVGRRIDARGPRVVMTVGSLVAVPGLLAVATAPDLVVFYAGWVLVGLAMSATLYPPAFAALTRWGGRHRVRALTTLTLVGGLASTVFAPTASALETVLGWRGAYLVLLLALVVVTAPLHWWGLRHAWRPATAEGDASRTTAARTTRSVTRSRPFVLLAAANALTTLSAFAVLVNLVPMMVERGMAPGLAAVALGLGGVGQALGRLGYARLAAVTTVRGRTVGVMAAVAVATAALAVAPTGGVVFVVLGMVLGLARGVYTLVQATAVTDRWGPTSYGALNGVLGAPALVASAAAPFVGAVLAHLLGGYAAGFLALAGVAALGAALAAGATLGEPGRRTPSGALPQH
ncbi:MFS transporter [Nocardioides aequoreus]|uniref:MFS transporter n=1 Tax=Nocardioides aequoreus TaxID=397278 RepID=UPI00068BB6BA|nr:MFS transporter [Nocardioides aequoreus]